MEEPRMRSNEIVELAHEFRMPLAILSGNLEMLEGEDGIRNRRALRIMRETVDRLARLTGRTLEEVSMGARKFRIVDASILLEGVYDECVLLATNRGVTLAVIESVPAAFRGDADQMKEVLLNLVSNALQHTQRGGAIGLSARLGKKGLELMVADTGSGIPSEALPYIFDRFYRIGERIPGALGDVDARGTGLGLHICRKIVESHSGTIEAESELGKGSRFIVSLPTA